MRNIEKYKNNIQMENIRMNAVVSVTDAMTIVSDGLQKNLKNRNLMK